MITEPAKSIASHCNDKSDDEQTHLASVSKAKGFKIMSLNIYTLLNHLDELRILVDQEIPHVIRINETKIDSSISDTDIQIEGYRVVRRDRNKWGGGVALFIHESISNYCIRSDLMDNNLESLSIQIKLGNFKPFIITSVYLLDVSVDVFREVESLVRLLDKENKESIIIGDTNCDLLTPSCNHTKHLKTLMNNFGLTQLIKEPTRITVSTQTLIDHIIINRPEFILHSGVIRCGISDHDSIYMVKRLRIPKLKAKPKILNVRNYKRFNLATFQEDIKQIPVDQIKNFVRDPNEMWEIWKRFFLDCLNKHAPITQLKVKGNHMPYVTSKLRSLIRTRNYLKTKAVKTDSSFIRQAFIQLRGRVYSLLQKSRNDYYTKRINENKGNMKNTWKILKHAIGIENKDSTVEILNSEGQQISNTCEIVEALNEHFVKVGKRLADEIPQSVSSPTANIDKANTRFEFMEISASNIVKVIKKLISGKATGLDGIPNKALKDSA